MRSRLLVLYFCPACMLSDVQLFCDPMDCSPPSSSVHEISQLRIQRGLSFPPLRDLLNLGIEATYLECVSCIGWQILYHCAPGDALSYFRMPPILARGIYIFQLWSLIPDTPYFNPFLKL